MAKIEQPQYSFTSGEISPFLYGREDLEQYSASAELLENFVSLPYGGVTRRPGTIYVAGAVDNNRVSRLISFQFSLTQSYVIEFSDRACHFFRDGIQIESSPGVPYTLVTTYRAADLFELQFAQSNDVLYVAHSNYPIRKFSRRGHTNWTIADVDFKDGPYLPVHTGETTLEPSATNGNNVEITASRDLFTEDDVGRLIRLEHSGEWGWCKIVGYTNETTVTVDVTRAFGGTGAVTTWRLGAFGGDQGYPRAITLFQQRLMLAGTTGLVSTIWGSVNQDFENMSPTDPDGIVLDDSALTFTIAANENNTIVWMSTLERAAIIGTNGGPFSLSSGEFGEPLTPTQITVSKQTTDRSSTVSPVNPSKTILYASASKMKLHELAYVFEDDGYASPDMTLLSEHITKPEGIKEIAYAKEPFGVIWAVLNDGSLRSFTYLRAQSVTAWCRHSLGGSNVVVESVCSIPDASGTYDEIWLAVRRTVNGERVRYIERLARYFDAPTDVEKTDAVFVDSSLSYNGSATTSLSSLDHLEGETVAVLGDGAVLADVVVSSGAVTVASSISKAAVGLPYHSNLRTLDLLGGNPRGSSTGLRKRPVGVAVRLYRSLGLRIGTEAADLQPIQFRSGSDPMDASPPLFTGIKQHNPTKGWDNEAHIYIRQDQPLPCSILSVAPFLDVGVI